MAISLVQQLQADAIQRSAPITDLLRKAKLVAAKLKRSDLSEWIGHEIGGYEGVPNSKLPAYRQIHGVIKWRNPYQGWMSTGADVTMPFGNPIGEIVGLLGSEGGFIMAGIPRELAEIVRRDLGLGVEVRFHASCAALGGIVEGARNAVLDWALKLEEAGIQGEGLLFSSEEAQRAQAVHINIGSIGSAVGLGAFGNNATITATLQSDIPQLRMRVIELVDQIEGQLPNSGLPILTQERATAALKELKTAVAEPTPKHDRLHRGLVALQHVMEGAAGNVLAAGALTLISNILSGQ